MNARVRAAFRPIVVIARSVARQFSLTGMLLILFLIWLGASFYFGDRDHERHHQLVLSPVVRQRYVADSLEHYFSQHGRYPSATRDPQTNYLGLIATESSIGGVPLTSLSTFERSWAVDYVSQNKNNQGASFLIDSSSPMAGAPFCYYVFENADGMRPIWITWAAGPNRRYEIETEFLSRLTIAGPEDLRALVTPRRYDPTNGSGSAGDIVRIGPSADMRQPESGTAPPDPGH